MLIWTPFVDMPFGFKKDLKGREYVLYTEENIDCDTVRLYDTTADKFEIYDYNDLFPLLLKSDITVNNLKACNCESNTCKYGLDNCDSYPECDYKEITFNKMYTTDYPEFDICEGEVMFRGTEIGIDAEEGLLFIGNDYWNFTKALDDWSISSFTLIQYTHENDLHNFVYELIGGGQSPVIALSFTDDGKLYLAQGLDVGESTGEITKARGKANLML